MQNIPLEAINAVCVGADGGVDALVFVLVGVVDVVDDVKATLVGVEKRILIVACVVSCQRVPEPE